MIETVQENKIIFDGGITLSRPSHQFNCRKSDDNLLFIHRDPLVKMAETESRLVISGLRLFKDNMKIEITGQV